MKITKRLQKIPTSIIYNYLQKYVNILVVFVLREMLSLNFYSI